MKVIIRKIKNFFHFLEAFVFALYYGFPGKKLKVIGVTGTDGKTTTVNLIYQGLEKARKRASMISSVYAKIGKKIYDTGLHTTTPSARDLQKYLAKAVKEGDEYIVLEVTAHALDQHRVDFIDFNIAVLTNITPEHLLSKDAASDYFFSFQKYLDTKVELLKKTKIAVLNKQDKNFKEILKKLKNKRIYTYGFENADFVFNFEKEGLDLPDFLKENFLAAYSVLKLLGIKDKVIKQVFKEFKLPPGRLEVVYKGSFAVVIDFAHTINSFKRVLPYIKEKYGRKGRLIHVFGVAGERDFTKREKMGEESGRVADIVILTEEDYRNEDPYEICSEVARGLEKVGFKRADFIEEAKGRKKIYLIEIKRDRALEKAISLAKKGDIVLSTGKGHEKSLARGKKEYPWDEKQAIFKILKKKGYV